MSTTPAIWPPKALKFAKNTFLIVRAISSITKQFIHTRNDIPIPSDWEEQEVRFIHTPKFTWSINSNQMFTQKILKMWITKDKLWHISLVQKNDVKFQQPILTSKDILFSEKEVRKVGKLSNGIRWISSEKGFRYIVNQSHQLINLNKLLT